MNKKIALLILVLAMVGCLALTACDAFGGNVDGTYYGYSGTEKNPSDYFELNSGKWTDGTMDGTYELDGNKITMSSDGVILASGTVEDGVLTISSLGLTRKYYTDAGWRAHGTLTPGGNTGGNGDNTGDNGGSVSSDDEDRKAKIVSVEGGTLDGLTVNMELADTVTDVDLSGMVTVSDNSSWKLYYNRAATSADAIATKMIEPTAGENIYYIVVTSSDEKIDRTYTLKVWKNYYVNITWKMVDTVIATERVLTHTTIDDRAPGNVAGYEFISWNIGNPYVEGPRTIEANYKKAKYTISFNVGGGEAIDDISVSYLGGKTLPTPSREGYTFNGWTISGLTINGNYIDEYTLTSNSTATASWTVNRYSLTIANTLDEKIVIDELDSDEYDYDNRVLLKATPYLGYELEGWYECDRTGEPLNKISTEESFYYTIPARDSVLRAEWRVRDDMSNFEFTSTVTSTSRYCKITGVKNKTITSLVLPDCVTGVEDNVFNDCTEITSAKMDAQKLKGFGDGNTKLTHLEVSSGAINSKVESVTHLTIGKLVSSVLVNGWSHCNNLVSVTFEEGFSGSVFNSAFSNCANLSEINVPDSLWRIHKGAFAGTAWYNNQPDGVVYIGKVLLGYKGTMPENTSIVVKEDTLAIAINAFYGQKNLTSVTVPSSVMNIGSNAFGDCTGLKEIAFSELSWYKKTTTGFGSSDEYYTGTPVSLTLSETPSENVSVFLNSAEVRYYREAEEE